MDTDNPLLEALARDLDGSFETLVRDHQDRLYSIALRLLGDPRDAEEAAQDAFVRAYRALARYDAARIGELRLRPWLATIVLNLCRTRLGRRAPGRSALSLDAPLPGDVEPRTDPARGPAETVATRDTANDWAGLLLTLPPPTGAPSCCDTWTASATPNLPPPSNDPRAPSKPRSTEGWPCCGLPSKPPSGANARR